MSTYARWSSEEVQAELTDATESEAWYLEGIGKAAQAVNDQERRSVEVYGEDRYGSWPASSVHHLSVLQAKLDDLVGRHSDVIGYGQELREELAGRVQVDSSESDD